MSGTCLDYDSSDEELEDKPRSHLNVVKTAPSSVRKPGMVSKLASVGDMKNNTVSTNASTLQNTAQFSISTPFDKFNKNNFYSSNDDIDPEVNNIFSNVTTSPIFVHQKESGNMNNSSFLN